MVHRYICKRRNKGPPKWIPPGHVAASHHHWDEMAQESLYVMCNASQDVASLKQNATARGNPNSIRIDTVASSASTTAKVAAVVQRGGSFLSGSFTDLVWAEDCAGRATVCLTRSTSYTVLISPPEMKGLIGMAQVIGAKTLGISLLTRNRGGIDLRRRNLTRTS